MKVLFNILIVACIGPLTSCNPPASSEIPKQKIAFMTTRDGNFEVYLMDSDGENVENLTNNPATDYAFAWSPSGETLLFYTDRDGNNEIYSIDLYSKAPINLTNHPSSDRLHAWSPNG